MPSIELIEAVRTRMATSVKAAIAAGGDVNQQDANGWTPLCWAAGKGAIEIVELLVEHGADPHRTGRDNRKPSMIAAAAGHVVVARFLRDIEARIAGPAAPALPARKYCKAFHVRDLSKFVGWPRGGSVDDDAAGSQVVYLHESHQVTRSMWADEQIVFDGATPEWRQFCRTVLGFAVPEDVDLTGIP